MSHAHVIAQVKEVVISNPDLNKMLENPGRPIVVHPPWGAQMHVALYIIQHPCTGAIAAGLIAGVDPPGDRRRPHMLGSHSWPSEGIATCTTCIPMSRRVPKQQMLGHKLLL